MPSFKQKFSGFFRQFSTPSESRNDDNASNRFIKKYLNGNEINKNAPVILHGRTPQEVPPQPLGQISSYDVISSLTGPHGGLMSVNQTEKQISASDSEINFIDNIDEECDNGRKMVSTSTIDMANTAEETSNSESKPNILKKLRNHLVAGVENWNSQHTNAYGASCSLYEVHPITHRHTGDPIADCFAIVTRANSAIMVLADGVNWGVKSRTAARSAVHGCVDYLNKKLFPTVKESPKNTTDVLLTLLRSFHAAHNMILQEEGTLTTLTAVVVLPSVVDNQFVACCCNVGDSLGYVYSPKYGVRELTQGSHDIHRMRDMRDVMGALGPVDGQNPELSNLTLSITQVDLGDIVFITSDGVSDNLDPVVGHFTGLPSVEAYQRHKLSLLRTEDLIRNGVSGKGPAVDTPKDLVTLLLDFVTRLTAAKRRILEDIDIYADVNGKPLAQGEVRQKRKEVIRKMPLFGVPGKLDHATVVAYKVSSST
ncbi:PP2C-like domain-containing protein CG9801 isoform X2 [Adelges cooleyi]|uniref:PP2C-like domain-containing protein CG9801 isoform X2 n=1 Tax=Adelges cooleyi TaxID=133065 RepID=UPI00218044A9|nr:PP2C-like domain-containing protein CG9801 isoform X2 [Adelges cooleyi]